MTLEPSTPPTRSSLIKWFLVILTAKLSWLFLFTLLRNPNWNPSLIAGIFGIYGGDSLTYYYPVDQLLKTGQYHGMCRMPGVLPIYLPLRLFLTEVLAHEVIVFLQVIFDSIATLLLAKIAFHVFKTKRAFSTTILISCLTCFVSVRNSYLLSDSLCISALITTFYFLSSYFETANKKNLIYAGIFLSWAIFLRQITLLAIPIMAVMIFAYHRREHRKAIIVNLLLMIPLTIALNAWTIRNIITFHRPIVLVAPIEECMFNFTPELVSMRKLIIGMGEDFQPWSKGGGAYWFFNQPLEDSTHSPFKEYQFTSYFQENDFMNLRIDYRTLLKPELSIEAHDSLQKSVVERANQFLDSYRSEHTFQYYIGNKVRLARMFLFPGRIDDIPFPPKDEMNIIQKAIKVWALISLWLIHAMAILALIWFVKKKSKSVLLWVSLPVCFAAALSYMGYIEQRYLVTSFPFFILIVAGAISQWMMTTKSPLSSTDNENPGEN